MSFVRNFAFATNVFEHAQICLVADEVEIAVIVRKVFVQLIDPGNRLPDRKHLHCAAVLLEEAKARDHNLGLTGWARFEVAADDLGAPGYAS